MRMSGVAAVLAALVTGVPALAQPAASPGTTGTVNAVDVTNHVLNLTHGPIPALGWPGMTMDFGVAPSLDLKTLKPGDAIDFTVGKTADGGYLIDSLTRSKTQTKTQTQTKK
jgi:Cu/Ag efflux protein CusF